MGFKPGGEFLLQGGDVRNAVAEQRRTDHGDACAGHQELDDVSGIVNTTGRCEIGLNPSVQDRYPA